MERDPCRSDHVDGKPRAKSCEYAPGFNVLCDPEPLYSIQVDTPQPILQSSPRAVVNPHAVFVDGIPYANFVYAYPYPVPYYPSFMMEGDGAGSMGQMPPSSAGYGISMASQGHTVSNRPNSSFRPYLLDFGRLEHVQSPVTATPNWRPTSGWNSRPTSSIASMASGFTTAGSNASKDVALQGSSELSGTNEEMILPSAVTTTTTATSMGSIPVETGTLNKTKKKCGRPRRIPRKGIKLADRTPYRTPRSLVRASPGAATFAARALNTPKTPNGQQLESPTPIHRKSRGCWTCKCRRKKCDEAKPACSMCSKLELPCMGYSSAKPDCMITPEKNEETRISLANLTKQRKEKQKLAKEELDPRIKIVGVSSSQAEATDINSNKLENQEY